jgi:hypothetical protein
VPHLKDYDLTEEQLVRFAAVLGTLVELEVETIHMGSLLRLIGVPESLAQEFDQETVAIDSETLDQLEQQPYLH